MDPFTWIQSYYPQMPPNYRNHEDAMDVIGEIVARVCDDGSCEGDAWVGRVHIECSHPQHKRDRRVEMWKERMEDKEWYGLQSILDNYDATLISYGNLVRGNGTPRGTFTIHEIEPD